MNTNHIRQTSGAHIIIASAKGPTAPKAPGDVLDEEALGAKFDRLHGLKASLGPTPNKHDLAFIMITAAIEEGFDTHRGIIGALGRLGLNPRHVAVLFRDNTGPLPGRHHWKCDADGCYTVHAEELE